MNLVLDESFEEKAGGEKAAIGMVVSREMSGRERDIHIWNRANGDKSPGHPRKLHCYARGSYILDFPQSAHPDLRSLTIFSLHRLWNG